ncbi:acyl-CoA synthetase [Pacificimonas flava]|uniref:Acyl-CoA synthetase n=2 Tax=Pacificimonas TaxID=1960290 RepID=A0A219B5Z0_9SPHN|nr:MULTISPECIES: AMP-binding protein [Pacificimonas]MBZ6379073.1 AMP-binding protein [Pacificimonas aurantium]OWV33691.1 acyl-CoA synthetase [Pacificimonas flava]
MHPFHHAAATPDKPAIIMADGSGEMSYAELEAASNRAAQFYRSQGLKRGDTIVIFLQNCLDYLPLCWGAQRAGLIFVAMSTKLSVDEAQYIVDNSGADLVIADVSLAEVAAKLKAPKGGFSLGGDIDGYEPLAPRLAEQPASRIEDESQGRDMLYSSGTTGRPKGITGPLPDGPIDEMNPLIGLTQMLFNFGPDMKYLSPAPLYHAAPLRYCMAVHRFGGTVVIMKKFDPERFLALVEEHRITHSQLVPTMFVRMLKLPEDVRSKYDVSSLKVAIHAAAPCPIEVKRRMMEWWGPVIYEYYSATEGTGFTAINPQEWMEKQGSVGKALLGEIRIIDEDGNLLPQGREGRVFFAEAGEIEYHGDPEKSASVQHPEHGATFGDIGYVDEDGYLFLTDRAAYMIITGGVNVYPQEAEDVLVMHPKVQDVAVIGVPHEEMGEEVKAVVEPRDWADAGPELEADLIAFARERLSHVKCPRSVDFEKALPRHDTGKLYKRLLKDRYWNKEGASA